MKTISKIILIPAVVVLLFFACSKDDSPPEPEPTPVSTLTSINPESGMKEAEVTLTGSNFGADKSKVKVFFNTTEASVQSVTNTQIKVLVPENGSSGAIKVIVNGTTISGPVFTYLQPTLSSIIPESAQKGSNVTFIGSNFGTDASKIKVFFTDRSMNIPNETEAVIESVTNTEVVVVVPEIATTGNVRMEIDGTELSGPEFTLLELTLTDYFPKSGSVGTEVIITGNTFGTDVTKIQVFFNGIEADIQSLTDTEIKVVVPERATTGDLSIETESDGNGVPFTVLPSIVEIVPSSGTKETEVLISGYNFSTTSVLKVYFNGKEATVISRGESKIFANVPPKAFSGKVSISFDGVLYDGPIFNYIVSEVEVSTLAGGVLPGFNNGSGAAARFNAPQGIMVDEIGTVYVADTGNNSIRKITSDGEVSTLAGNGTVGDTDGTGDVARFRDVSDIAISTFGEFLVTDKNNYKIKRVTSNGEVSTYAGTGANGNDNGPALSATFGQTTGIVTDSQGNTYVVENDKHRIRKISTSGEVSTFAGGGSAGTADGNGTNAGFNFPYGIAVDIEDNLYVTDSGTHLIRKISSNGDVTTIAGSTAGFADGQGATAQFNFPTGIVIDDQGEIYVTDGSNNRIRKISPDGNVTTLAGDGTSAQFNQPQGITINRFGDLYVADRSNNRIQKITQE